jgi:hypothetical protein
VSLKNHHDGVLLGEWFCVASVGCLVGIGAPGEGPRDHEALHHFVVLEFVPDGVGVAWASLLQDPPEVI